jgi:NAD(P)-dependent dehydrogenase (short-subunit alcohol dehydrogenase family)
LSVVVLGAGNIGLATASRLAARQRILLLDRREPPGLGPLLAGHPGVRFVRADVSDPCQLEAALAQGLAEQPLTALLCTVGTRSSAGALDDPTGFERDFDTNLFGNLVPLQLLLPRLLAAGRGKLAVVSSTSGHHAPCDLTAYAPSKWALASLCGALRSELRGSGVGLDVVAPTNLRNRHSEVFTSDFGLEPERVGDLLARRLERRGGRELFLPRSRRAIHLLERLAPAVLDRAAGLRAGRRRRFARTRVDSALITGASRGLGRELARSYAPTLRELWIVARSAPELEALRVELESRSDCRVHARAVDMGRSEAVAALAEEVAGVELVINNAGLRVEGSVVETPLADFRACQAVNFLGPVRLASALLAAPRPPRKLVNVLSTTAIAGRRGLGAYASSKAALWSFTRSLRRVRGEPLQVLEVLPASFDSGLVAGSRRHGPAGAPGGPAQHAPAARRSSARALAARIHGAEAAGCERLLVPLEARLFLWLEALAPPLFRRLFP